MVPVNSFRPRFLHAAEQIYEYALMEADAEACVKRHVFLEKDALCINEKKFDLSRFDNIYFVAIGKPAPYLAQGIVGLLSDRFEEGIVVSPGGMKRSLDSVICLPGSHPLPDEKSFQAGRRLRALAEGLRENDLLILLISGGGSALVSLPSSGISIRDKRRITKDLLKAGASIDELNTVRKHLSRIKGGFLAQAAFPATVVSLVVSDVVNNDLESIASGPTYWDSSTFLDSCRILKKYNLWENAPISIRFHIEHGIKGEVQETLKKDDPVFKNVHHFVIGDNQDALKAAEKKSNELGFQTIIITSKERGEARIAAKHYTALVRSIKGSKKELFRPLCLLIGGELTVSVKGKGKGGRNQEFVLASLLEMERTLDQGSEWLVLSLGTDGVDGDTDAAGAWGAPSLLEAAGKKALDLTAYLEANDSYHFFEAVNGLVKTGPTRTNVMDLRILLFTP